MIGAANTLPKPSLAELKAGPQTLTSVWTPRTTQVRHGFYAKLSLLRGVDQLANVVSVTLGPKGRNVCWQRRSWEPPRVSKDGATIAQEVELHDKWEDMGCALMYHVANHTNQIAGDGTTTATILGRSIAKAGMRGVVAGYNPMELKRGIHRCAYFVSEYVLPTLFGHTLNDSGHVGYIARISANGDDHIGSLVAKAVESVGYDGVIDVIDGKTLFDHVTIKEGFSFDKGYLTPSLVNNYPRSTCEFDRPLFLLYTDNIKEGSSLVNIVEQCHRSGRALVIIAPYIMDSAIDFINANKLRAGVKIVGINCPGKGDYKRYWLEDIAALTGASLIAHEAGMKLEDASFIDLGEARRIVCSQDSTAIFEGFGDKRVVSDRIAAVRRKLLLDKTEDPLRQWADYKERLAALQQGMAVISVGGNNQVEVEEKKDRVTDALNSVRSAMDDGIIPGAGSALMYAGHLLDYCGWIDIVQWANEDQRLGAKILANALSEPAKQIIHNSGRHGAVVCGRILDNLNDKLQSKENSDLTQIIGDWIATLVEEDPRVISELDWHYDEISLSFARSKKLPHRWRSKRPDGDDDPSKMNEQKKDDAHRLIPELDEPTEAIQRLREMLNQGYDSQKEVLCDLFDCGIVDPLKVVQTGLLDSSSVAGLMVSMDAMITNNYIPYNGPPEPDRGDPMTLDEWKKIRPPHEGMNQEESDEEWRRLDSKFDPKNSLW